MSFIIPFFWQPMQSFSYFLFLGVGIFFSVGIYFQIIALSFAKASVVQPFHYTLILWAIILGYIFYNDLPDIPTIIGAIVITLSGIYVLNEEQNLIKDINCNKCFFNKIGKMFIRYRFRNFFCKNDFNRS